jgi:hypothetical protein
MRGTLMAPEQENSRGRLPVAARSTTCNADKRRGPTMCSSAALSACDVFVCIEKTEHCKQRQAGCTYVAICYARERRCR